jgi:hypothetical protein
MPLHSLKVNFNPSDKDVPEKFLFFRSGENERLDILYNLRLSDVPDVLATLPALAEKGTPNTVFIHSKDEDYEFSTGYGPKGGLSPDEHRRIRVGSIRKYDGSRDSEVSARLFSFFYPASSSFRVLGKYKVSELVQMSPPILEMVDMPGEKLLSVTFRLEHERLKKGMAGDSKYEILLDIDRNYSIRRSSVETTVDTSKNTATNVVCLEPVKDGFLVGMCQCSQVSEDLKSKKRFTMVESGRFYYSPHLPNDELFTVDSLKDYGYNSTVVDHTKDTAGISKDILQGRESSKINIVPPSSPYSIYVRMTLIVLGLALILMATLKLSRKK